MSGIIRITLLVIITSAWLCGFTGCSGADPTQPPPQPEVGEIQGPDSVEELKSIEFSISVDGGSGITYSWSCDPPDAGQFYNPTSFLTNFTAMEVESDTQVKITVTVGFADFDPVAKHKDITVTNIVIPDPEGGWATAFGGTGYDYGRGVATDDFGNIYIVGNFSNNVDFDPGMAIDWRVSNGYEDAYIAKFDSHGEYQWAVAWGGEYYDHANKVAVDSSGNAYVLGEFYQSVDFDPSGGTDVHTSNGGEDIYLCKYDTDGNFQWAVTWGGEGQDSGQDVAVDSAGNVFVTGGFRGTVDFDPGVDILENTSNGHDDVFLCKFDPGGELQWAHTWGASYSDKGYAIDVDDSGNVYATGEFYYTVDFDPSEEVVERASNGMRDVFLSKFGPDGNFKWTATWGGEGSDIGRGVAISGSEFVYITGTFRLTCDFDPGAGVEEHISNGNDDVFLAMFGVNGVFHHALTWGAGWYDYGHSVGVDSIGNVYVAGSFWWVVDFNPGPDKDTHGSMGFGDAYLIKFHPTGIMQWTGTGGGAGHDGSFDLAIDTDRNIFLTGYFSETGTFAFNSQPDEFTSNGHDDVFLAKFKPDGSW